MHLLEFLLHPATITATVHLLLVSALAVRVIMRRPATGVALAWLVLIAAVPFFGAVLYLLVGERRVGRERTRGVGLLRADNEKVIAAAGQRGLFDVDWKRHDVAARGMDLLGRNMVGSPTVCGSRVELMSNTQTILEAIARDVDAAKTSVLMEFYIWNEGGSADAVLEAVMRAARRGVSCRLLIDALGARPWWKGKQQQQLREAGVDVRPALPVGFLRTFIGRTDLRLHRKIVVVDGQVAWTGSLNMVDPRFFKQGAGVGEWVDAMTRVQGAAVVPLAITLLGDWALETRESIAQLTADAGVELIEPNGSADIQVIASGPGETGDGLLQMILGLIYAAREEIILTTPYLVPDDSLLRALRGAAASGVNVSLIVPEKVDSMLTRYASRSYYDDLLSIGVQIYLYRGGLLHTKSIMVDGKMSMFGTVNLDMRSLWLNFEVAMFIYDADFASKLRALQQSYLDDSDRIDPAQWALRSFRERFLEDSLRLMSPLL